MLKKIIVTAIINGIILAVSITGLAAVPASHIPIPTNPQGAASAPKEINHKKSMHFTRPDFYNMHSNKHMTILNNYPTYQQTTEETCGPAAALTVLYYLGDKHWTEEQLAKGMKTLPYPVGTSTKNMVDFFVKEGYKVDSSLTTKETFPDYKSFHVFVLKNIAHKTPILVENVEWGGHWRVIIGYDTMGTESTLDDVLIMADPYDTSDHWQDGYTVNNGERFYAMWFDIPSARKEASLNKLWITISK